MSCVTGCGDSLKNHFRYYNTEKWIDITAWGGCAFAILTIVFLGQCIAYSPVFNSNQMWFAIALTAGMGVCFIVSQFCSFVRNE